MIWLIIACVLVIAGIVLFITTGVMVRDFTLLENKTAEQPNSIYIQAIFRLLGVVACGLLSYFCLKQSKEY